MSHQNALRLLQRQAQRLQQQTALAFSRSIAPGAPLPGEPGQNSFFTAGAAGRGEGSRRADVDSRCAAQLCVWLRCAGGALK